MQMSERLQERLETMALVAQNHGHPEQYTDMREMTRLVLTLLGTVLAQMRQGSFGAEVCLTPETVRLTAEEQVEIARAAIHAAKVMTGIACGAQAAEQYQDEATAELERALDLDTIAEEQALLLEQAAEEAHSEATRLVGIEEIFAVLHRLN